MINIITLSLQMRQLKSNMFKNHMKREEELRLLKEVGSLKAPQ